MVYDNRIGEKRGCVMTEKKLISIVVPAYNEQDNILVLYDATLKVFAAVDNRYDFEFIFVNDGSRDKTWSVLEQLAQRDPRVIALSFSRNFGHQAALMAGYEAVRGDAIVSLDCDMQHPPQLILEMIQKWEAGAQVVYARRTSRQDKFLKKYLSLLFYWLLDLISDVKIPRKVNDFRLLDRQVLAAMLACHEKQPYFRGLVAWVGFKQDVVEYQHYERHAGVTGYTWKKMIGLAWNGITGYSLFPLRLAAYFGFLILFLVGAISCVALVAGLFFGAHTGLTFWLVQMFIFILGVQFIVMWLLGEYVGAVQCQTSDRPVYIVAQKIEARTKRGEQA
jgi:polyisoprenyl-phosphate glycosyltransferase